MEHDHEYVARYGCARASHRAHCKAVAVMIRKPWATPGAMHKKTVVQTSCQQQRQAYWRWRTCTGVVGHRHQPHYGANVSVAGHAACHNGSACLSNANADGYLKTTADTNGDGYLPTKADTNADGCLPNTTKNKLHDGSTKGNTATSPRGHIMLSLEST